MRNQLHGGYHQDTRNMTQNGVWIAPTQVSRRVTLIGKVCTGASIHRVLLVLSGMLLLQRGRLSGWMSIGEVWEISI